MLVGYVASDIALEQRKHGQRVDNWELVKEDPIQYLLGDDLPSNKP